MSPGTCANLCCSISFKLSKVEFSILHKELERLKIVLTYFFLQQTPLLNKESFRCKFITAKAKTSVSLVKKVTVQKY